MFAEVKSCLLLHTTCHLSSPFL